MERLHASSASMDMYIEAEAQEKKPLDKAVQSKHPKQGINNHINTMVKKLKRKGFNLKRDSIEMYLADT
jgi:hypothetical protein